jgi:octaprenyl-diphosphate synthase
MKSNVALLDKIMHYIIQRKGKQIRPMFVFLSAKLCGEVNDNTYVAASMVELLHTASLVHDDVVDDSFQRRGFFSINALWKNKIAVLVGDYLFSRGLLVSLKTHQYRFLHIMSKAVQEITEGELLQIEKARRLDIKEDTYYDIIRQKTASLIAAACSLGAASVSDSEELIEKMRLFGETIGLAFQIKDDLMDYGMDDIGKPTGIDIQEKKMTLPLIFALQQASSSERKYQIKTVKKHNKDKSRIRELMQFVTEKGGIHHAEKVMRNYKEQALELLSDFDPSPYKDAMESLIHFVIDRKK